MPPGGAGGDTLSGIENLTGSAQGDTLSGFERLVGSDHADVLSGSSADEAFLGGLGADTVNGGAGKDTITGGAGTDTLTGGGGLDTFVYTAVSDSAAGSGDTITDFVHLSETIDLSAIDANTGLGGDQAFTWRGTGAFTNTAGQLRYTTDGTNSHVFGDVNGDSVADFEIHLTGVTALSGADFVL